MENIVFDDTMNLMVGERIVDSLPFVLAQKNCQKVMIVCDEPAYRLGYVDIVTHAFAYASIDVEYVYKNVGDVATVRDVEEIKKKYKHYKCDCIVAIGKKAAIMAAKGAKTLIVDGTNYVSHYVNDKLSDYQADNTILVTIPTNFGSGFEALPIARIYDKINNFVYEFTTHYSSTDIMVLDTAMTDIIPPKAIATFGLFALDMSLECFIKDDTPMIGKAYADAAIGIIFKYLTKCIFKNANREYRQKILEAVGFASCGYAMLEKNKLLSPLSDIISDKYLANYANIYTILFRQYIKSVDVERAFGYSLNSMVEPNDYALYAKEARIQKTLAQIEGLYQKIENCVDYNSKLRDFGVTEEDLDEIAESFMINNDEESIVKEDVMQLLRACL